MNGGQTRSRNSRTQDTEGRRGSRNDARKMHREKPAFNAGEQKKENRGIPRGTEQSNKPLKERKKKKMAKITMMSGIASISGRVGNCCFRTMKATGKVYMHQVKDERRKVKGERPASEAMVRQRKRFSEIAKMVMQMKAEGSKKSRKQLWKIATKAYESNA